MTGHDAHRRGRQIARDHVDGSLADRMEADASHSTLKSMAPVFTALFAVLTLVLLFSGEAHALSFEVEFRSSTYQVTGTDTYDDLVAEHATGAWLSNQTLLGIDGVSSVALAGTNRDYSTLITTTFVASVTGTYQFQMGTDWGNGGGYQAVDTGTATVVDTYTTPNNLWWAYNWGNADVLTMTINATAGETYALGWVGFEDCCAGDVTFRFSVDGSAPATFDETSFAPFEVIPEPGTALLVGAGLAITGASQRRRRR